MRTLRTIAGWIGVAVLVSTPGLASAKKQQFVYVHDRQDGGGIYAWSMDKHGGITSIAGSPFPLVDPGGICGGNCQTMAYSPKRKTLYTGGPSGVSAWTVNKDGTLTSVPGSPFSPGVGSDFLGTGVVEVGKRVFVYSASFDDGNVYAWEANDDGSLTELAASPFPSGTGPDGLAVRKKFVFVANESDGSLSSFVAGKDGTLVPSPTSPFFPPNVDFFWNTSPDVKGKVLYVDDGANGIRAFAVDKKTAELTQLEGSPFATDLGGAGVMVSKKFAWSIGFNDPANAFQPFKIVKKGALESQGIVGNTPIGFVTFTSDKNAKRMVLAGFDGVATATLEDKEGRLTGLDIEGFLVEPNPNAVVMVQR